MSPNRDSLLLDIGSSFRRLVAAGGVRRVVALAGLTMRDAIRSRALLGLTAAMVVFATATLLWPADSDQDRVILIQRYCFGAMTLFGILAAVFLGCASLPSDLSTKRIYAIISKPVSRLEILLGKTLGLLAILFIFMVLGGVITIAVSHIANARRTYAGGSYLVEVTSPEAKIKTAESETPIEQGEVLPISGQTDEGYEVSLPTRLATVSGILPTADGQLRVRSIEPRRIARPDRLYAVGTGIARVKENELLLGIPEDVDQDDLWQFDLPETMPVGDVIHVRLRFPHVGSEPPFQQNERRTAALRMRFGGPEGPTLDKDVRFLYRIPQNNEELYAGWYEEVFDLPRSVFTGKRLDMSILDIRPRYPRAGMTYFKAARLPVWQFDGINPKLLASDLVPIQMHFAVQYTKGMEYIDVVDVTCEVRNRATGETWSKPLRLRNLTALVLRVPRRLIDERLGVEVRFTTIETTHRIGVSLKDKDVAVYMTLADDAFWASTARSVLLIFLYVSIFATFAVAASTFLSMPVAILFVLVMLGFVGLFKAAVLEKALYAPDSPFAAHGTQVQENAVEWVLYLAPQLMRLIPGLGDFSSSAFVRHGWSVPWAQLGPAALMAVAYSFGAMAVGFLAFRKKEVE